jgi:hypothetical protein
LEDGTIASFTIAARRHATADTIASAYVSITRHGRYWIWSLLNFFFELPIKILGNPLHCAETARSLFRVRCYLKSKGGREVVAKSNSLG